MSSTEEILRRFHAQQLVPVAEQLRSRGVRFFPLGPDASSESWYVPGPSDEPEFVEVEAEGVEEALRALWKREGLPELEALASEMMALAQEIEVEEEQSADVSPFIYVMY